MYKNLKPKKTLKANQNNSNHTKNNPNHNINHNHNNNKMNDDVPTPLSTGSIDLDDIDPQELARYMKEIEEEERLELLQKNKKKNGTSDEDDDGDDVDDDEEDVDGMEDDEEVDVDDDDDDDDDNVIILDDEDGEYDGGGGIFDDQEVQNLLSSRVKEFEILTVKEMVAKQNTEVAKVCELLGVTPGFARVLLRKFQWKEEKITNLFLNEGREALLNEAGLSLKDEDTQQLLNSQVVDTAVVDENEEITCELCYDDVLVKDTTALPCGHRFCNSCWKTYVEMKINEGQSRRVTCMGFKCESMADEVIVGKFISGALKKKIQAIHCRELCGRQQECQVVPW